MFFRRPSQQGERLRHSGEAGDLSETDSKGGVLEAACALASAGGLAGELIRAVKSCTTGPMQRRCQRKRTHHPLRCHLLSWWAGGSEQWECGKARTLSLFHFPRFAGQELRLRFGSRDLGWNPQARARSAAYLQTSVVGSTSGASVRLGVGGHHGRDWLSLWRSIGSVWAQTFALAVRGLSAEET